MKAVYNLLLLVCLSTIRVVVSSNGNKGYIRYRGSASFILKIYAVFILLVYSALALQGLNHKPKLYSPLKCCYYGNFFSENYHSWIVAGITRVSKQVRTKVVEYYQQVIWGEVGTFSEHVLLWWGGGPLFGSLPPQSCQLLCDWLRSYISSGEFILSSDHIILFVLWYFLCAKCCVL